MGAADAVSPESSPKSLATAAAEALLITAEALAGTVMPTWYSPVRIRSRKALSVMAASSVASVSWKGPAFSNPSLMPLPTAPPSRSRKSKCTWFSEKSRKGASCTTAMMHTRHTGMR